MPYRRDSQARFPSPATFSTAGALRPSPSLGACGSVSTCGKLRSTVEQRTPLTEELRYRLLKLLQENPSLTQRELAAELGISLGKVNYCLQAVIYKGWVKARNFKNSRNKAAYAYYLTAVGVKEKAKITIEFLRMRLTEVETLREEIATLQEEVKAASRG